MHLFLSPAVSYYTTIYINTPMKYVRYNVRCDSLNDKKMLRVEITIESIIIDRDIGNFRKVHFSQL